MLAHLIAKLTSRSYQYIGVALLIGTKIYLGMAGMSNMSAKSNNNDSMNFIISSAKIWFLKQADIDKTRASLYPNQFKAAQL